MSVQPADLPGSTCVALVRARDSRLQGETVQVALGARALLGRSKACTWSLKRTLPYLQADEAARARLREEPGFAAVSRRHCRISYLAPDLLEVENLSRNGTWVDGLRVERLLVTDLRARSHTVQLGREGPLLEVVAGTLPALAP